MKQAIKNSQTTLEASRDAAEELAKEMEQEFVINIRDSFKQYLKQAKALLHDIELVEKTFQNLKDKGILAAAFQKKSGEFSTSAFVRSGKEDFAAIEFSKQLEDFKEIELSKQLNNIKTCLMNSFVFVEKLKEKVTRHKEKYLVGIGGEKNIVGILNLNEIMESVTLAIDSDTGALKLMIGNFDALQRSINMGNQNNESNKHLATLHKQILNRFYFILNTFKSFNKSMTKENKITISAGYVFEVAIKSLNQKDNEFKNLSQKEIVEYYLREKSTVPFFREGDINDISVLKKYLKKKDPMFADQYSVKMVMSMNQLYGPSLATITTLKSVLNGVVLVLSQKLNKTELKNSLRKHIFSVETGSGPLNIAKLEQSIAEGMSNAVAPALEEIEKDIGLK